MRKHGSIMRMIGSACKASLSGHGRGDESDNFSSGRAKWSRGLGVAIAVASAGVLVGVGSSWGAGFVLGALGVAAVFCGGGRG